MILKINGKAHEFADDIRMEKVLESFDIRELSGVAIALNYRVVPKAALADIQLKEGDEIEIVRAVQGG